MLYKSSRLIFFARNAERSLIMAVFRIEKTQNYTVMSNHHLRNKTLTLKAKGLSPSVFVQKQGGNMIVPTGAGT